METKYDILSLKKQLCFPIYLCAKEIVRSYTPLLEKIDLTYTQYIVMMYFWEKRKSNVKTIGDTLLLDSSTLTPLLKKLEHKGLITRVRSSNDERNLEINITPKGLALRDPAVTIPTQMCQCLNLTLEEATTLYQLMNKIIVITQNKKEKKSDAHHRS